MKRIILLIACLGLSAALCALVLRLLDNLTGAYCFSLLGLVCFATTTALYAHRDLKR